MNIHSMEPKAAFRLELKKIAFYSAIFAVVAAYNFYTGVYGW